MRLSKLIAVSAVGALMFPVANANEMSDRFIAACVADGDTPEVCTCSSAAMQSTFSEEQFAQIVSGLEAGGSDAAGTIIEGILEAQPALIEALVTATAQACE